VSRVIDFNNLNKQDLLYIGQRPWMEREAVLQGHSDVPRRIRAAQGLPVPPRMTAAPPRGKPVSVGSLPMEPINPPGWQIEGEPVEENEKELQEESEEDEDFEDDEDPEDDDETVDYSEWTVADLRSACAERGIPRGGNHSDLVVRLTQNDSKE
jgi:hypothetical protein